MIRTDRICGRGQQQSVASGGILNSFNNSSKREDRLPPFFFLLFPSTFSHFLLSAKEEKEKVDKENQPQMILKRILSRARERCRNYIATERVFCLATEVEPHRYQHSLFLWQLKAQRKSLAKRNAEKSGSPLRRRGGLRALHRRQAPLKRGLDSPNKKAKTSAKHLRF